MDHELFSRVQGIHQDQSGNVCSPDAQTHQPAYLPALSLWSPSLSVLILCECLKAGFFSMSNLKLKQHSKSVSSSFFQFSFLKISCFYISCSYSECMYKVISLIQQRQQKKRPLVNVQLIVINSHIQTLSEIIFQMKQEIVKLVKGKGWFLHCLVAKL